jgi:hypothetical protein
VASGWGAVAAIIIGVYNDMNTRLMAYARAKFSVSGGDLSSLVQRDLAARTGDYTARKQALIADATEAMQ